MKKFLIIGIIILLAAISAFYFFSQPNYFFSQPNYGKKGPYYSNRSLEKPVLVFSPPTYNYTKKQYNDSEYSLPLKQLPENYQRDIEKSFNLNGQQKEILLKNGILIIQGNNFDRFDDAYSSLRDKNIPIFITSDSILHLYHLEFDEILKNLEITQLSPMLKSFLKSTIIESIRQYNGLKNPELKELSRRNIAYLSVAMKLLDPDYKVPSIVKDDVDKEIKMINEHAGIYKSEIFSKDCPSQCQSLMFKRDGSCRQDIKGKEIFYDGKYWDSAQFYKEICTKKCYCEDYSQYIPRGHYTQTEGLKRYFKAMMWLGRMSFKIRGENWTKQAILLTDVIKATNVSYNKTKYPAYEIWKKIYTVTGFFAGASDDLTFYDYDKAVNSVIGYGFDEDKYLNSSLVYNIQKEIGKMRGPKILSGFEIDLAGNLKDLTQGMRFIGQRYALDSQILGDLVYKNVGPNIKSPHYEEVINYCEESRECTKPSGFYYSCKNMDINRTKYWNEVCSSAVELYCGTSCDTASPQNLEKLYSVCRFVPKGLDVANVLGSEKANEILEKSNYCNYKNKSIELKKMVNSYSQENWTKNLYNAWLWMLQPILKNKPNGYPNWMRSDEWKLKDLITFLSSWAELRHDTILYVKQSYTWAGGTMIASAPAMPSPKYYGYVEPNPEFFERAKFSVDYLEKGLQEQGVLSPKLKETLEETSKMDGKLEKISEKELEGKNLTQEDYDYIMNIDGQFKYILKNLASVTSVKSGHGNEVKTSFKGNAFKTTIIADVHTDSNSKRVLEVGSGKVDWIIVAHKSKDGRIGVAVGPVFSYYEFTWPMSDRLTDEKWREVLPSMERPNFYNITDIKSSSEDYIIK